MYVVIPDVDSPCVAFDRGTPLHIAAANLAVDAARCLVQNGANPHIRDDLQRTPLGKLNCNNLHEFFSYSLLSTNYDDSGSLLAYPPPPRQHAEHPK